MLNINEENKWIYSKELEFGNIMQIRFTLISDAHLQKWAQLPTFKIWISVEYEPMKSVLVSLY